MGAALAITRLKFSWPNRHQQPIGGGMQPWRCGGFAGVGGAGCAAGGDGGRGGGICGRIGPGGNVVMTGVGPFVSVGFGNSSVSV